VILSDDGVLRNPLPSNNQQTVTPNPLPAKNQQSVTATLNEGVRALILQALEEAGWMIGGPEGAAVKLGLKRTSLIYKMKKLGIVRVITRGPRTRAPFKLIPVSTNTDSSGELGHSLISVGSSTTKCETACWMRSTPDA
jgi:hypothetical protein